MQLRIGDRIVIDCQGRTIKAIGGAALNYGTEEDPDWYIEGKRVQDDRGFYWKQRIDGGTVTKQKEQTS